MIADPTPVIECDGRPLPTPISWTLATDLLTPADQFSCELPLFVRPEQIATDAPITVRLGRATVFSGRIDERGYGSEDTWQITCRDNCGRLVDESIPGAGWSVGRGSLTGEILRIVSPWFSRVEYSNAADRVLRRGSSRGLARVGREPVTAAQLRAIGRYLDAGMTRWAALQKLLVPLGLLAWSSADGSTLIVAKPAYSQAIQYRFLKSPKASNVLDMSYSRSVAERYQEIIVSGSGKVPGAVRVKPFSPPGVKRRKHVVNRSLGRAEDTSGDFRADKRLFVVDTTLFPNEAQTRADRLLGEQIAKAETIEVTVPGLGQTVQGGAFVLYAPDTLCAVRLETARDSNADTTTVVVDGLFLITQVNFSSGADGSRTSLSLVPKGAILV